MGERHDNNDNPGDGDLDDCKPLSNGMDFNGLVLILITVPGFILARILLRAQRLRDELDVVEAGLTPAYQLYFWTIARCQLRSKIDRRIWADVWGFGTTHALARAKAKVIAMSDQPQEQVAPPREKKGKEDGPAIMRKFHPLSVPWFAVFWDEERQKIIWLEIAGWVELWTGDGFELAGFDPNEEGDARYITRKTPGFIRFDGDRSMEMSPEEDAETVEAVEGVKYEPAEDE